MRALKERSPFIPEVHLFHNRDKFAKFFKRTYGTIPELCDDAGAQAWCDNGVACVLVQYGVDDRITEYSLLVHEAWHVIEMHYAWLGEEHVGGEFAAYGVQVVSDALMRAQKRWRKGKGKCRKRS